MRYGYGFFIGKRIAVSELEMIAPDGGGAFQTYTFTDSTGNTNSCRIRFPAGYNPDNPTTYKVIVWLHGKGGSATTVETSTIVAYDAAVTAGVAPSDVIHLIPNYGGATWWTDAISSGLPARTMLNLLRARIAVVTRASASNSDWHLYGFSMGGFGAASWFADSPTSWGSLTVLGGANLDSTTGNNWATGDAADYADVFGSDPVYLAAQSPAQKWATNAAAIIASGVPIRTALGASDATVSASMAAFRSAITTASIKRADDSIASATHSMSSYATNDGNALGAWVGAVYYSFKADTSTWVYVVDMEDTGSYRLNGSTVDRITNLISGVNNDQAANGPTFSGTGLNGKPCMDFNGTSQQFVGVEAAVTNEVSGSDQPHTIMMVAEARASAIATLFCFANSASANGFEAVGTNNTGTGRWRVTKGDDAAALSTCAQNSDGFLTGTRQLTFRTASGISLNGWNNGTAITFVSSTFDRGTTTLNRWAIGARVRNVGPTIDERANCLVGFIAVAGSEITDNKKLLCETKLRQRWRLTT